MPGWFVPLFGEDWPSQVSTSLVRAGKVEFVPKSSFEDRTIVVEPTLNTLCQAAVGDYMASRLRRAGVDIKQQKPNREAARKGSLDGSLATVDLSSASDTVSREVVADLLGLEWFSFLSRYRTGAVVWREENFLLEKFSSMGNGFTFPLETLIFYALAWGVCAHLGLDCASARAYGDDIVIPTEGFDLLREVLVACGFVVNVSKSYWEGSFRESCGADFFHGTDIRPYYLRPTLGDTALRVSTLFSMHNFFVRRGEEECAAYLRTYLHPSIQLFGPDGYGDGHLIGRWCGSRKTEHVSRGFGGFVFDTFTWKSRETFVASPGSRVLPCFSTYTRERSPLVNDRLVRAMGLPIREYSWVRNWILDLIKVNDLPLAREWTDPWGDPLRADVLPGVSGVNRVSVYTFERPCS